MSREPTRKPRIPCRTCGGTGKTELPSHLFAVLLEVRALGRATAAQVHKALYTLYGGQAGHTAYNNRLESLRRLGFLQRERTDGKTWTYSLAHIVSRKRGAEPTT